MFDSCKSVAQLGQACYCCSQHQHAAVNQGKSGGLNGISLQFRGKWTVFKRQVAFLIKTSDIEITIIIIIIIIIYKDLIIEVQRMRNVKTRLIPVIIGATGTISKSFIKHVSNIPGQHDVKKL